MKEKLKNFYSKKGAGIPCTIAIVFGLLAILILFGTVLTYETKIKVGDESVKEYFNLSMIGLLDSSYLVIWPMILVLVSLVLGLGTAVALYVIRMNEGSRKATDVISVISMLAFIVGIISIFLQKELFVNFANYGNNKIPHFNGASLSWASAVSMMSSAVSVFALIGASGYAEARSVKTIAEDGVLIAAAFVLNFVKIPVATGGGSINFQMLPLMIIALRRGPLDGFVAGGIVYGLLTCLTDGYGLATYPFDYLIGFGSVAVMGFFRGLILGKDQTTYNLKGILFLLLGGVLSTFVRFIGGCASSMVIYGVNFVGALTYNGIYIPVSGAIALAVIIALYGPLLRINRLYPSEPLIAKSEEK